MSFNSFDFYLFLAVALTGHALLNGKAMQAWLCVMSYLCYGGALIITMALFYAPSQEPFIYFQF